MPTKPARPCKYPGCPNLTTDKTGYCEEHRKKARRQYDRYERDPNVKKMYGSRWRKVREMYIAAHPLCEECLKQGKSTLAEEVHHIRTVKNGGDNSFDNLMSLCRSCHNKKHIEMGDR